MEQEKARNLVSKSDSVMVPHLETLTVQRSAREMEESTSTTNLSRVIVQKIPYLRSLQCPRCQSLFRLLKGHVLQHL